VKLKESNEWWTKIDYGYVKLKESNEWWTKEDVKGF
jgi:hypothetical protein